MSEIRNYVHALSQLDSHHSEGISPFNHRYADETIKHQVLLLDQLALLLVFRPGGDVVSTGVWTASNEVQILWAKNSEVTDPLELESIRQIFNAFVAQEKSYVILFKVIKTCRLKILHRAEKLAKTFALSRFNLDNSKHNLWHWTSTESIHLELKESLIKQRWARKDDAIAQWLDDFTRNTARLHSDSSIKDFARVMLMCYAISKLGREKLVQVISSEKVTRISKLADYIKTVGSILEEVKKIQKSEQVNITLHQIVPPRPESTLIHSGTIEALNLRCSMTGEPPITDFERPELRFKTPSKGSPESGLRSVMFRQHCELTIVLEVLRRHSALLELQNTRTILVGCSEFTCKWCLEYLDILRAVSSSRLGLVLRGCDGKQTDGWMMPPGGPPQVARQMSSQIEEKVDYVFWSLRERRQRSDSAELPNLGPFSESKDVGDDILDNIGGELGVPGWEN